MTVDEDIELAQLANPPLIKEAIDKNIPIEAIFGTLTPTEVVEGKDLSLRINTWLAQLNTALDKVNQGTLDDKLFDDLFAPHASWKDHLAISWDFHQFHGIDKIKQALEVQSKNFKISKFKFHSTNDKFYKEGFRIAAVAGSDPVIQYIEVFFDANNVFGQISGMIKLLSTTKGLKAYGVYTALESINGNEEYLGERRPKGVDHGQHVSRTSWLDKRDERFVWGEDKQPTVLIIGGGQGGLNLAARLKVMGISHLIIEKNPKIGDNWRNRYKFLVLHDPVWYDHMAYINFPETWPIFTPKDKLGGWFESYAESMELSYWTNKSVTGSSFDETSKEWTVKIVDNETGEEVQLHPKHLVMATGHSGEPNIPHFKGEENFKGVIVHSSKFKSGKPFAGKNALVIGCCNSGHDIAHDLYEQGVNATILQRSSTCVITSENGLRITNVGTFEQDGPPVAIADIIAHSSHIKLQNLIQQQHFRQAVKEEPEFYESLAKAGFNLDAGFGSTGLFGKYVRRGGGYYIDVGCSKLITEGKIKIRSGVEIDSFGENSVTLSDGSVINDLSIVVLATGYSNMKDSAFRITDEKVVSKLNPVWGLDDEGELKTIWRQSGYPGFWFMGGNLALSRYFSKRLALQIIAYEKGFL